MPPPHTAVLGSWDFSAYTRVGPDDGLDPYTSAIEDPAFSEASLAEGQPLIRVSAKNREGVFPLFLGSATSPLNKDALHALQRTAAFACKEPGLRLQWKDAGATNISYYDVTYARFEPAFHYRRSQKGWLGGVLRVFSAPPYAHSGTERLVSTGVQGALSIFGAVATLPAGSVVGDVAALPVIEIDAGAAPIPPSGRVVLTAPVPTGYRHWIPAASMFQLCAVATRIGASGAPGSQYISAPTLGGGGGAGAFRFTNQLARFALSASPHAGDQHVFGIVRPPGPIGVNVSMRDDLGKLTAPTALATGIDGWQLVDLGVVTVPTTMPTSAYSVGVGIPSVSLYNNDSLSLRNDADHLQGHLAGMVVLPEDRLTAIVDRDRVPRAGGWPYVPFQTAATAFFTTDLFGNRLAGAGGASGPMQSGEAMFPSNPTVVYSRQQLDFRCEPMGDVHGRMYCRNIAPNLDGQGQWMGFRYADGLASIVMTAQWYMPYAIGNASLSVLRLDAFYYGLSNSVNIPIASVAGLPLAGIAALDKNYAIIDFVKRGDSAYVNFRWTNPNGVQPLVTIYPGTTPTTVPVACIGFIASGLRQFRVTPQVQLNATAGPVIGGRNVGSSFVTVANVSFAELTGVAAPSDAYTIDSTQRTVLRTPQAVGSSVKDSQAALVGPFPTIDPRGAAAVVAVMAPIEGGPLNDQIGVEVAVRERFSFAR